MSRTTPAVPESTTTTTYSVAQIRLLHEQGLLEQFLAAEVDVDAPAVDAPVKANKGKGKKPAPVKATLKPLSHGEIKSLRAAGAEWVKGKTAWQLQGRKPANTVAKGRVVPESVLAKHGYCRPTSHVRDLVKG